jgi:rod shape determining protein RodA
VKIKFFEKFDYFLILVVLTLVTLGILFIYSSSVNSDGVSVTNEHIKQIIWASIGFVFSIVLTIYDFRKIEKMSLYLYITLILLLIYTFFFGKLVNGAKSWIGIGDFGVQPSEFGKLFFILYLAHFLNESKSEEPLKRFVKALIILCVPMGLILIQPDLGTASVYLPIFIVMCFIAGVPSKYLIILISFGLSTILFAVLPVWNTEIAEKPLVIISILTNYKLRAILIFATFIIAIIGVIIRRYFHGPEYINWIIYTFAIISLSLIFSLILAKVLKTYQIKRLIIFMNPNVDPRGAGWNIIQSQIAIGAGGLFGKGYLMGTQSHYRFLPQQSTDFIFSILSEELGFIGCCLVFLLFFFIFVRTIFIIRGSTSSYGAYIASGILGMFAFHFFINVGMVMGMMPITGIPLSFLSYGGSSLLTSMSCIGLLMSINYRRKEIR